MILPETREQVRISTLRYAAGAAARGMNASLLVQFLRTEFRKDFKTEELEAEFEYLRQKGLLEPVGKSISPEVMVWRITAAGRDWLAEQRLES